VTFSVQHKVEVQFVPGGSFIDISSRSRGFEIVHPRATPETVVEATTFTVVLDNTPATAAEVAAWGAPSSSVGYAPFTTDNPVGAFSPNIERDRMVRLSYTWNAGANTSVRALGWSDKWSPDLSGDITESITTLTGSDVFSRYERRDLISDYGEKISGNLADSDYWPYDDDADATFLRGLSLDRTDIPPAQVIPSIAGTGTLSLEKVDASILVDGCASFSRGEGNTASPVILHKTRPNTPINRVSAWIRLNSDVVGSADDIIAAYNKFGEVVWRFLAVVVAGNVVWKLIDAAGNSRSEFGTNYPRDDSWHWLSIVTFDDGGSGGSQLAIRDKSIPDRFVAGYIPPWPYKPYQNIEYIVVGGNMNPRAVGKQGNTVNGSVSGLWVTYGTAINASYSFLSATSLTEDAQTRAQRIIGYVSAVDSLVGGGVGGSDPDLTPTQQTGANTNALEAWREHVRTTQGRIFTQPDGRRNVRVPSVTNPPNVSLTLDAGADLDLPAGGWTQERTERPTRQTVTAPIGTVTLVDAATEATTGLRLTGSDLATSAGDLAVARGVAYRQMSSGGARLSGFGFDVTLMATDQRAAVFALLPYDRVRVTNLPSAFLGLTYMDVWASGWAETYDTTDQSCVFVMDTDPADDPPVGVFDSSEYGRFGVPEGTATVTGGTCVGNTGTGTIIITSASPWSTSAGDYPADVDWNGERVTVTTPGGSTSPQTFTVTARGVAPTIARVHSAGESAQVWHAMRFGA
jgi:hypothetical protein